MTISVSNTANTDTVKDWRTRTNQIAGALSSKVVTVDSNAAIGDAQVIGNFTANAVYATTISGGNTSGAANVTFSSNVTLSSGLKLSTANATHRVLVVNSTGVVVNDKVALSDVSDVDLTGAANNSVLRYDEATSKFVITSIVANATYAANAGEAANAVYAANSDKLDGFDASYFANSTHVHPFSSLTGVPTTAQGYGLADVFLGNSTVNAFLTNTTLAIANSTTNVSASPASIVLANSTVSLTISKPTAPQVSNGNFFLGANGSWQQINATPFSNTVDLFTGSNTTAAVSPSTASSLWKKGSDIASANAITIPDDGSYFHVTGTTNVADIDFATTTAGREVELVFDDVLTLVNDTTTLALPGNVNIVTAAGDTAVFRSEDGDNVKCVRYDRAAVAPAATGPVFLGIYANSAGTGSVNVDLTSMPHYGSFGRLLFRCGGDTGTTSRSLQLAVSDDGGSTFGSNVNIMSPGTNAKCTAVATVSNVNVTGNKSILSVDVSGTIGNATESVKTGPVTNIRLVGSAAGISWYTELYGLPT